jgi:pimeloyl-ACP methyl ester carboxylesterase
MNRKWWIAIIVVLVVLGVYFAISAFFADVVIDAPTRTLAEAIAASDAGSEAALLAEYDMPEPQDVMIRNGDVELSGWYFENEADADCAVLFLHGYTGTRTHSLSYTPLFWDRGCDLLAYDARGHGDSTDDYHSYGFYEKEDGVAAYEWLLAETGLSADNVGIIGVSYGASTSLQMLPLLDDAAFVLADSPYSSLNKIMQHQAGEQFGDWAKAFIPGGSVVINLRADFPVSGVAADESIQENDIPVLLIHSVQDAFTPAENSQIIFDNANESQTQLALLDWGSRHAAMIRDDPEAYEALFEGFLNQFIPEFAVTTDG